jgi:hypothetical protein
MSGFLLASPKIHWLPIILGISGLHAHAQTCLVLSQATIATDGTASMELSLNSSSVESPAALQWTFRYPTSSISSLIVDGGPMLTSAGKTTICGGDAAAYKCLAVGANTKTIANGVIAKVIAVLAPGASRATMRISDTLGTSAMGYLIPVSSRIEPVTGAYVSDDCRLRPPPGGRSGSR